MPVWSASAGLHAVTEVRSILAMLDPDSADDLMLSVKQVSQEISYKADSRKSADGTPAKTQKAVADNRR